MKIRNYLLVCLAAFMAVISQSCSSDKAADASEILATIPSDVSLVTVINSQSILEKAGCKVENEKITPGPEVQNAISKITDPQSKKIVSALVSGESGINPSVMVIFREGYNTYLTGSVYDTAKLKKWVETNSGEKFTSSKGIDICANTAIADNRFWINLLGNSIDVNDIRHFNTLAENQSFLQNSYAEKLASITKDIEGWGNISGLMNTGDIDISQRMAIQLAVQAIFEDPSAITFSVNSTKGSIEAEAGVVNSKGKGAKFLLPSDKLDTNAIAAMGGTADMISAISLPGKLIENLQKNSDSKTGSMFGAMLQQFSCVDGTAAAAVSDSNTVKGFITTNGKDTSGLTSILSSGGLTVSMKGNQIDFSRGTVSGTKSVSEMAPELNGAIAGVVVAKIDNAEAAKIFKSGSILLVTESGSLIVRVKAIGTNPDVNPIITALKF